MSDCLKDGHLSNMHKQSKRLPYPMGKLNLFIEFKINRPDIYLFHGK